jgi:hypothetical protein
MKQVFTATTREEANREADKWWAQQSGLRIVHRTEITVGWGGPSLADADKWIVTIHYEPEN